MAHASNTINERKEYLVDPILYWNDVLLEADRTTHTTGAPNEAGSRGPAGASRSFAIVSLAMHDAYYGINPGHPCYLGNRLPMPPDGADTAAAIAAAAHSTLSALYPAQKTFFDSKHLAAGLVSGKSSTDGHDFGQRVAAEMLALRKNDPSVSDDGYSISAAPGRWRQDPNNSPQGTHAPFYGARSHLFAATRRHHLDPPPQLGSAEYDAAVREVRAKGIAPELMATLPDDLAKNRRTPAETAIGIFWAYDGVKGLGTPPRLYNQIVRKIAQAQGNDVGKNARLFGLVNAALGDAGILAWNDKFFYEVWRPVLGVREHDSISGASDGTDSIGDPFWLPLGAPNTNNPGSKNFTPPFPAYPSGHSTFGAAMLQTVRQFYGQGRPGPDNLCDGLEFVSDELNGISTDPDGEVRTRVVRKFPGGLWHMILENARSRVYLGVHWVFDTYVVDKDGNPDLGRNVGGVRLGMDIANDIAEHGLIAQNSAGPDA
ncbi:MAG TPA: hypothetical protein VGX25_14235 [Actinophytocola sp.]|uniref:vanadium-dependent haloperoxidase n=1 Tax=Actinophytocola sp. TaxID=1872138 RepID=UPI002DDD02E4|nr:hypothetical protein [Actinophytocola sp.]HEV2780545.1 hypothetical protein [Actinophytocola sp.]